jgi:alginate O-acetyltransferase complex protein AlgI
MLFNSLEFLIFFPLVCLLYFLLPHKYRWLLLLVASCYFYMVYKPIYILIIFFTIIIDYFAGILIENASGSKRKLFLLASLIANIGVLAVFKYYGFFHFNIDKIFQALYMPDPIPLMKLLLPVGLSFHTFQAMSYAIEVYRGNQKAERHFGIYALYVMFFPQMVAGPIERPQNMLHQFYEEHFFDYYRISAGLKRMLWGFFKKAVIADRLAWHVDMVYNDTSNHYGWSIPLATVLFAFQIYGDFSGYSDIALGAAQVMGFKLMKNFDRPYFARSLSEFWRRWHISLSSWFRDYLYIPLGGNRVSIPRKYLNLLIVFVISGFWHGANWTFLIWGAVHGIYLVIEQMSSGLTARVTAFFERIKLLRFYYMLQRIKVFALVCFAWMFFRAGSIEHINMLFSHSTQHLYEWNSMAGFNDFLHKMYLDNYEWLILLLCIGFLLLVEAFEREGDFILRLDARPAWQRWVFYSAVLWLLFLFGEYHKQTFIYFAF